MPTHPLADPTVQEVGDQFLALKTLQQMPMTTAIGAACAFLLHCAETQPVMTRRVLHERIIHNGFAGESLIHVLRHL